MCGPLKKKRIFLWGPNVYVTGLPLWRYLAGANGFLWVTEVKVGVVCTVGVGITLFHCLASITRMSLENPTKRITNVHVCVCGGG